MEAWKVFFATALGAGVGSLVALEVSAMFWWIGLIAGGLTGYLSYEWRAVLAAIPAAYRATRNRQPDEWWKAVWRGMYNGVLGFYLSCLLMGIEDFYRWLRGIELLAPTDLLNILLLNTFLCIFVGGFLYLSGWSKNYHTQDDLDAYKKILYLFAPPIVLFWHLPRGMWWMISRAPRATMIFARFLRDFMWQIFLRIHSERRLICAADAMLGAAVGYSAGSALIGAVAGGIFGVVNYAVVTERWLKPKGFLPIRTE